MAHTPTCPTVNHSRLPSKYRTHRRQTSANTTTTTTTSSSSSSSHHSRTKLLNRLGYFQPQTDSRGVNNHRGRNIAASNNNNNTSSSSASSVYASSSVSLLGSVRPTETKLNDSKHRNNRCSRRQKQKKQPSTAGTTGSEPSSSSSTTTTTSESSASSGVRFNDVVTVMSIPSRHQYSNRIKRVLWSGRDELYEMSQRNIVEFQAEGWDWRTVVEDDDMYIDCQTGQKLHPCHYDLQQLQQRYDSCPEQQQQQEQPNGVSCQRDHQDDFNGCNVRDVDDDDDDESSEFEYSDDDEEDDDGFVFRPLQRGQSSSAM